MLYNILNINDTKTEFIIIGSKGMLIKSGIEKISVGDTQVVPSETVRNLGVWFNKNATMVTTLTSSVEV